VANSFAIPGGHRNYGLWEPFRCHDGFIFDYFQQLRLLSKTLVTTLICSNTFGLRNALPGTCLAESTKGLLGSYSYA
jgi:hypothetical protein